MLTSDETMEQFVERYKQRYDTLRPVYCPALKDQVYFTAEGFNHLLFKKGHRRPNKQVKYRLPLISLVVPTLMQCKSSTKTIIVDEIYKGRLVTVIYFELTYLVGRKCPAKIKVVVKKRGNLGQLFFFSVMKQKTPRKGR